MIDTRGLWQRQVDEITIEECLQWLRSASNSAGVWADTKERHVIPIAEKTAQFVEELKIRHEFEENKKKETMAKEALSALHSFNF